MAMPLDEWLPGQIRNVPFRGTGQSARIQNSNIPMTQTRRPHKRLRLIGVKGVFGRLDFGPSILSFDVAQDGELVELFRVFNFVLRIYRSKGTSVLWAHVLSYGKGLAFSRKIPPLLVSK